MKIKRKAPVLICTYHRIELLGLPVSKKAMKRKEKEEMNVLHHLDYYNINNRILKNSKRIVSCKRKPGLFFKNSIYSEDNTV